MIRTRIRNGIAANGFATGSSIASQLLAVPVLVGSWGLPLYGAWLLLSTVPGYLAVGNMGLSAVAGNDMAMLLGSGERARARAIFHTAWAAISAVCALILVVGVIAALTWPKQSLPAESLMEPGHTRWVLIALTAYSTSALRCDAMMAGYRASGMYARGTTIGGIVMLIERAATLATALLGGKLLAAAICMALVRSAGTVYMQYVLAQRQPDLKPGYKGASFVELRRMAKLAGGVVLFPASMALNLQGPLMILGALFPPAIVGLFGATRTLTRFSLQVTNIVSTALMPEYSTAYGCREETRKQRLFALNIGAGVVLLAGAVAGLLLFGGMFVRFWTIGRASPDFPLLLLLTIGTAVQGAWLMTANLLLAANRQYAYTPAFLAISIFMLAAGYALATAFGVIGVAAALLVADGVMLAWVFRQSHRLGIGSVRKSLQLIGAMLRSVGSRWRHVGGR